MAAGGMGYNNEPEIRITAVEGDSMEFILSKTDLSMANAVRRCDGTGARGLGVLLLFFPPSHTHARAPPSVSHAEVPTMAIDWVAIESNSTVLHGAAGPAGRGWHRGCLTLVFGVCGRTHPTRTLPARRVYQPPPGPGAAGEHQGEPVPDAARVRLHGLWLRGVLGAV